MFLNCKEQIFVTALVQNNVLVACAIKNGNQNEI